MQLGTSEEWTVENSTNDGPGTIIYKTWFDTFTGKFVIHCHVLRHEDRSMMQAVEVI